MIDAPYVLTVDDDPDLSALVSAHLRRWGYFADEARDTEQLDRYLARRVPSVILMDVMLGEEDGSELVAEVRRRHPGLPVIMITRSSSVDAAVRCMKNGATDYITKPLDFVRLEKAVASAVELSHLTLTERASGQEVVGRSDGPLGRMVGESPQMRQLFSRIENVSAADVSVLILGETGTGKELVARAIHELSARSTHEFVPVNAAAIPRELIESSLFGHQRGAFTGAGDTHVGYCEQADGGTLFLDEIGEMDFDVQAKLLRFLQDHVVQRVGSTERRPVDVRVVAATNVDTRVQIESGRLREDLYYRLRVVSLEIPPLRARGDDRVLLAERFLAGAAKRHNSAFVRFSPSAVRAIEAYPWPGNVRQLENAIEEAVVLYRGETLTPEMLPAELVDFGSTSIGGAISTSLSDAEQLERDRLAELLSETGSPAAVAERLGISRATVYRKLKKYQLARS